MPEVQLEVYTAGRSGCADKLMMRKLRVLTFNIAHGRGLALYQGFTSADELRANLRSIAQLLDSERVDVAALQEIDQNSFWTRRLDMARLLCGHCSLKHHSFGVTTRNRSRFGLLYGNAILSRHPLHRPYAKAFGSRALGEKGFQCIEVELAPEVVLPILNLHLEYRSRARRLAQVEQIVTYLEERAATHQHPDVLPPIICGDFNSSHDRSGDAARELFNYLHERHRYQMAPANGRTFPSPWPRRCLDFIFVPEVYPMLDERVLDCRLSDHRPVLVEIGIPFDNGKPLV